MVHSQMRYRLCVLKQVDSWSDIIPRRSSYSDMKGRSIGMKTSRRQNKTNPNLNMPHRVAVIADSAVNPSMTNAHAAEAEREKKMMLDEERLCLVNERFQRPSRCILFTFCAIEAVTVVIENRYCDTA